MSATTMIPPETPAVPQVRSVRDRASWPGPTRVRPAARSGRSQRPLARPINPVAAPSLTAMPSPQVKACSPQPGAGRRVEPVARVHTQLTDRGIAVILVAGVMIVLAAVTVIGLTALRVTGDNYQPLLASQSGQL